MTKLPEPKEAEAPFRCPQCGGPDFQTTQSGQLVCVSVPVLFQMGTGPGCGWRGALQEPQMEIAKCL